MKKLIIVILTLTATVAFAQSGIIETTAQHKLKEISVSKMEDAGFWYGNFSSDFGQIFLRAFPGGSEDKVAIEDEEELAAADTDDNVVGVKVSFYKRGVVDFMVKPLRPLPIEGITKTISVWVAGRNTQHRLELLVSDHFGNKAVIPMGKLNFYGWKKLTVTIPPSIKQRDVHYINRTGLAIEGFNIRCNIDETYGRYYIYFDDIRAVTDLFTEESRDVDDMTDAW